MSNVIYFLTAAASNPNSLLTTVLLPFLLIFVILWGILNVMKIFGPEGRKINLIIALVITIFAAFTDAWGVIATQLAVATGVFTYIMFFAVFILGTIFWAIGRTRGVYHEHVSMARDYDSIKDINKELEKLYKKLRDAQYKGNGKMAESYFDAIQKLEKKRDYLIAGEKLRR